MAKQATPPLTARRRSGTAANPAEISSEISLSQRAPQSNQEVQRQVRAGQIATELLANAQGTLGNQAVQRLIAGALQRQAAGDVNEPDLGQQIRSASGRGSALDGSTRQTLERGLGARLSGVRVHTDGEADTLSRAVNAVAFTSGADIFFRSGTYRPSSPFGLHLLAHEAAHTVQQSRGPVAGTPAPGGVSISNPGDSFERAADVAASQVTAQRLEDEDSAL